MLSVALCTYNGEKFLDQQINSILNQSKPVNEIVICDDVSSDSTVDIIRKLQNKFPSIIKLHINNSSLGPIKNFEKAIGLCSGEIIFLSDHDDIWKQNKVERFVDKFTESPHFEAIFSDGDLVDNNNALLGNTIWNNVVFDKEAQEKWASGNALKDIVYKRNKITGATLAIKKELFKRAFPFPLLTDVWHDAWLGMHAAANETLGWISEPLIEYRIHSTQQVGIGNGVTFADTSNKVTLKEFLLDVKRHYNDVLSIIKDLSLHYPNIDKANLEKDAIKGIDWIDFRLNLSKNIFVRTIQIISHIKTYTDKGSSSIKTIIRDIITPGF